MGPGHGKLSGRTIVRRARAGARVRVRDKIRGQGQVVTLRLDPYHLNGGGL